jgi:hypothetical protein
MRTYVIEYTDRAGALERLLNKCRRKNLEIDTLHLGPADGGVRRVVVTFTEGCPPAAKVVPNLERVYDVVSIEVVDAAAQPSTVGVHAA